MNDKIIDCSDLTTVNYEDYLHAKLEPQYRVNGRTIIISRSPISTDLNTQTINEDHLFDYQKFILNEAIKRQRYAEK